ncbi:MAG: ABC transporter permease subunit [Eubacteriales bacterium]
MNKIIALYRNELIKISKKVSIIIFMIIMIIGCFGLGGVMKVIETQTAQFSASYSDPSQTQWYKDDLAAQIQGQKTYLADLDRQIEALPDTSENQTALQSLKDQKADTEIQIEMMQTEIDKEIFIGNQNNFLTLALQDLTNLKSEIRSLEAVPSGSRDASWQKTLDLKNQFLSDFLGILDSKNFEEYIKIMENSIADNDSLSASDKEIQTEYYKLWYQLDPSGGMDDPAMMNQAQAIAQSVGNMRRSIHDKVDYTGYSQSMAPMSPDQVSDMENRLAVTEYRINHNNVAVSNGMDFSSSSSGSIFGFGLFIIVLMMLVLAGGAVSQEISSGSIKSLIIAPVKRWKIFTAKVLSLLTVGLLGIVVLYIFGSLSQGLFFGFNNIPYVYASHGVASAIPNALYRFLSLLVSYIDIIVYMAFAFMLSVLTRNTAVAVGLSIATYFGGSTVMTVMIMLPSFEWLKFIPFGNLNLNSRIFPFSGMMQTITMSYSGITNGTSFTSPSLIFSLIYLVVFLFCMTYTAMDSFNRRDLK